MARLTFGEKILTIHVFIKGRINKSSWSAIISHALLSYLVNNRRTRGKKKKLDAAEKKEKEGGSTLHCSVETPKRKSHL